MVSENDSDYETYGLNGEYASPYTQRNDSVYTTPYATESKEGFERSSRSRIIRTVNSDRHLEI